MRLGVLLTKRCRVKLPKTFLAINLSDLFSFEEHERRDSDGEVLEMKSLHPKPKVSDQSAVTPSETENAKEELVGAGQALASASSVKLEDEEPVSPKSKTKTSTSETISKVAESGE